jgi:hypothetical protein
LGAPEIARRVDVNTLAEEIGDGRLQWLAELQSLNAVMETAPGVDHTTVGIG